MAKNKTVETEFSVEEYINNIPDENRREDVRKLIEIFEKASGFPPKMWGTAIIGFGSYHYKYESGHEGDAPLTGLSSRSAQISLYLSSSFENREKLLADLGKIKTAKACVYVKKLADIDVSVLEKIIKKSVERVKEIYG